MERPLNSISPRARENHPSLRQPAPHCEQESAQQDAAGWARAMAARVMLAVLSIDGQRRITATHTGLTSSPLAVGHELAAMLLSNGAGEILELDAKSGELLG